MSPWVQGFLVGSVFGTIFVLIIGPWLVQLYIWYLELVLGKGPKSE